MAWERWRPGGLETWRENRSNRMHVPLRNFSQAKHYLLGPMTPSSWLLNIGQCSCRCLNMSARIRHSRSLSVLLNEGKKESLKPQSGEVTGAQCGLFDSSFTAVVRCTYHIGDVPCFDGLDATRYMLGMADEGQRTSVIRANGNN